MKANGGSLPEAMENWYCIYTKPKMEEGVGNRLTKFQDIEIFNPKIKQSRYMRGRFNEFIEALFPCYLFAKFSPVKYGHMIKYTRGVRKILSDNMGNAQAIDTEIIDQIKSYIRDGFIQADHFDFNTGDAVCITQGPLSGFEGIFLKKLKAGDRVQILMNALAYQAKIEIDRHFLAAV